VEFTLGGGQILRFPFAALRASDHRNDKWRGTLITPFCPPYLKGEKNCEIATGRRVGPRNDNRGRGRGLYISTDTIRNRHATNRVLYPQNARGV
jgi:hypothetical protein